MIAKTETGIRSARHSGYIGARPSFNRVTGALSDWRHEGAFLQSTWAERKKLGIAMTAVLLASSGTFAISVPVGSSGERGLALPEIFMAAGILALSISMWCFVTSRPGRILDIALFLPCMTLTGFLANAYASGAMPWTVIPGIIMSSMFIYGVFLPHRPAYAMATLGVLLAGYLAIGILGGEFLEPVSVIMLVGVGIACCLMVRSTAKSKRQNYVQNEQLGALAEQLDRHLQDLGLEKGAVERAATENAALADELALARMAAEENATVLEIVLNNMSQGVLAFGPDTKVIECNRRYVEFMRLPEHLTLRGTPVQAIFDHAFAEGIIGNQEERDSAIESVKTFAQMRNFEPVVIERESAPDLFIEVRLMPLPGGGAVCTVTNISERKLAEQSMRFKALHDPLTGLANRELFGDRLRAAIARSKRGGHYAAVAMVDLDQFKPVNDTFGHPAGDQVLQNVGDVLTSTVREIDTVARLGGDEFAIIFDGIAVLKDVSVPIGRIFDRLRQPMKVFDNDVHIGASIGVAFYPLDAETPEHLERAADVALLSAKRAGRGRCVYAHRGDISSLPSALRI
jgi:diguanylate cyclase (GGDEF)-like protein